MAAENVKLKPKRVPIFISASVRTSDESEPSRLGFSLSWLQLEDFQLGSTRSWDFPATRVSKIMP